MKKLLFISLLITFSTLCFASVEEKLQKANELYAQEEFQQATLIYEELLATEGFAPELYYNLGNAYFKTNELGRAILNYERALRLNPDFENAKHNLEFAKKKVVDAINEPNVFFLKKWSRLLTNLCSSNQWLYLSAGSFVLFLTWMLLFIFSTKVLFRKPFFFLSIAFLFVSGFFLSFSIQKKNQNSTHKDAIVMQGAISVKSSPGKSSTDLYELHEGTKVHIRSTLGEWVEITVSDQLIGWVEAHQIEII